MSEIAVPFSVAEHPHSGHALVADANSAVVADCGNGECLTPEQEEAHARLFAAAPDLLEAGEHLAKVADDKLATVRETVDAVLRMRAAIAKATPQ